MLSAATALSRSSLSVKWRYGAVRELLRLCPPRAGSRTPDRRASAARSPRRPAQPASHLGSVPPGKRTTLTLSTRGPRLTLSTLIAAGKAHHERNPGSPSPVGDPRHHVSGAGHCVTRHAGHHDGGAVDQDRARRDARAAAVDGGRLLAGLCRTDPLRRCARGPVRPPTWIPRGPAGLPGRLDGGRIRRISGNAHRGPSRHGLGRGDDHALHTRDPGSGIPAQRAGQGDGHMGGRRLAGSPPRPARRWTAAGGTSGGDRSS